MIAVTFIHQAITVFSDLDAIITLGLLLLIPAIIIESLIIRNYSKKSWWKLFKFCVIINLIGSLMPIFFTLFADSLNMRVAIFCIITLLIVIIWVENIIYQKCWKVLRKGRLLLALIIINIIAYTIINDAIISVRQVQYSKRLCCINNLKLIGTGLIMYANDYESFLPNKFGAKGLSKLCANYLGRHKIVFTCPSTTTKKWEVKQKLSEENLDYIYKSGLKYDENKEIDYSKIPVVWDKPTNHENYGNVLFLDGHVKGFEGKDWMEQAGIKEKGK